MRILLDTSALAAMLARREGIILFKQYVARGGLAHVSSLLILAELEAVLCKKFGLTKQKGKIVVGTLKRYSILVEPTHIVAVCRDPQDDHVLAAAVAGHATYLVTADNDLLTLKTHQGVLIISPNELQAPLKLARS